MAGSMCNNTMRKGLFLALLAISWRVSAGQGTYRRSCECDYTVDGRCTYSLSLPVFSGSTDDSCSAGDTLAQVQTTLAGLATNLTQQALNSGDQARMLNTLQNLLLEQQVAIQQLDTCEQCEQLQSQVDTQQGVIATLQESLVGVQGSMDGMSVEVGNLAENVAQGTQFAELIETLEQQQTVFTTSIQTLMTSMQDTAVNYWLCHRKSLLVSGAWANISDTAITASSMSEDAAKARIRPYMVLDAGMLPGWCPVEPNDNEWLQFDLGRVQPVFGILTKGRYDYAQWVTSYKVAYSVADEPAAEDWVEYTSVLDTPEVFPGNTDQDTLQMNTLWQPVMARWLRIYPLTSNGTNQCLRADVLGCVDPQ